MKLLGYTISEVVFHLILLLATLITTCIAGVFWMNQNPLELANYSSGLTYAVLVILVLGSHEMGHLIAARLNGVDSTLPYFIPFPSFLGLFPFGTLGAVIRLRTPLNSRNSMLDIGASGPIAGFLVSTIVLAIGFIILPHKEYLLAIHPEYVNLETIPESGLTFGYSIWYAIIQNTLTQPHTFVPPMNEIYHYPFLCVGWLGLFVTAMNLLPVGQLDGGHISMAALGEKARPVSLVALALLAILGGVGIWESIMGEAHFGWPGWLLWAIILLIFTRGLRHNPNPMPPDQPLSKGRRLAALVCALILVLTFLPNPISLR